jgi:hypothetical protein
MTADLWVAPVGPLVEYVDPFGTPPWGCAPFTVDDVRDAIEAGRLAPTPVPREAPVGDHVARIAWLAVHGWDACCDPPTVDTGVPGFTDPTWPLLDGNHRLAAAAVRGDLTILVALQGDEERARDDFGMALEDEGVRATGAGS